MGGVFADRAALSAAPNPQPGPASAPDDPFEKYRRHLDRFDMSEDSKTDLLQAIWTIMGSFVDRAFGEDSVQLCRDDVENSGKNGESGDSPVIPSGQDLASTNDKAKDLSRSFRRTASKRGRKGN